MPSLRWIVAPLALSLSLPAFGCGLFRRNKTTTNVSSNVEINQQGRDVATLRRDEYEVLDTAIGYDQSNQVYFLTIPIGSLTGASEGVDNAYFDAVASNVDCDALSMHRVQTKRIVIPLLIINIVVRKNRVQGRCIHILENDALDGEGAHHDEGASDTGGGPEVMPDEPAGDDGAEPDPAGG